MRCPVRCLLHRQADRWLREGKREALSSHQDVWWTMRRRAWRACSCGLYDRIQAALR